MEIKANEVDWLELEDLILLRLFVKTWMKLLVAMLKLVNL